MSHKYIFEMIEIDLPFCSRTWGNSPCTASLSSKTKNKCWNLRAGCGDVPNFAEGTPLTLRFCKDGPIPKGLVAFPVLSSVKASSPTVNIAGSDPDMSSLGKLASLSFTLGDFTYHERGIDPYLADRISGAAQFSGIGYTPADQGTFLNKLKDRWPNYAGANVRRILGYIVDGVLTDAQTQHFFIKEIDGPNNGAVSVKAYGVLDLANKKTALCPKPTSGVIDRDMTATSTTFTLTPAGVGNAQYAASGWVCISSEIMRFARVGNVFTVARGQRRTAASSHSAGDTVQQVYTARRARIDTVLHDLVQNYTDTPTTYLDAAQRLQNSDEVGRWGASILLETDIVTPTAVATLLSELSDLGCSIWEDEFSQKIKIRMNRPVDTDIVRAVSDRTAKDIRQKDNDQDRLTQILFMSKRSDPTKPLSDDTNFDVKMLTVDPDAMDLHNGKISSRTIRTRWLDQGDDATVAIASLRLLDRFKRAPKTVSITLDAKEKGVRLADVIEVNSDELADSTGLPSSKLLQVTSREEPIAYHDIKVLCQAFSFDGRYWYIAPNDAPTYNLATDEQKATYAFISPDADGFTDDIAYQVI